MNMWYKNHALFYLLRIRKYDKPKQAFFFFKKKDHCWPLYQQSIVKKNKVLVLSIQRCQPKSNINAEQIG
jgi:hypothetical protein